MSRTIRRKGWTYWKSAKREAALRNSFFGNRAWINESLPEDYRYRINDVPGLCEAEYIHRDLGKQFRQNVYMGVLGIQQVRPACKTT